MPRIHRVTPNNDANKRGRGEESGGREGHALHVKNLRTQKRITVLNTKRLSSSSAATASPPPREWRQEKGLTDSRQQKNHTFSFGLRPIELRLLPRGKSNRS